MSALDRRQRYAALCAIALASCGGQVETLSDDAGAGGKAVTGAGGARAASGGAPGKEASAPAPYPDCLGPAQPITLYDGLPFTKMAFGAEASAPVGWFLLDMWTTFLWINLKGFSPTAPTPLSCAPSELGTACAFASVSFCGSTSMLVFESRGASPLDFGVTQAGTLGTDYTRNIVMTLDYARLRVHRAVATSFCTDAALLSAGLVPLDTKGFFSKEPSKQYPVSHVQADAGSDYVVGAAPVAPVRLLGTDATAALDTGNYDLSTPFSPSINAVLLARMAALHPGTLVRNAAVDVTVMWNNGLKDVVAAYDVRPAAPLDYVATDGTVARSFTVSRLYVYTANAQIDLAQWSTAAMHVGASFFAAFGVIAFDPFSSRVWVPKL